MKKTQCFKRAMLIAFGLAFILGCIPLGGNAQNEPTVFAIVDFMKAKPANDEKYLDIEKNVWKPLHQERINQGKIVGWILYRVLYTGTEDPYNYVTMTFFDNPANLEDPWVGIDPAKILTGRDTDKDMQETGEARDLVKTNLIMRQDEVVPQGGTGEIKYIEINYMKVKPGNDAAYIDFEKNIWKPIHTEFTNAGARAGWSLWNRVYPGGSETEYQYVTANYFSEFMKIGTGDYDAAVKKVHPDKSPEELDQKALQTREIARTELWQIVDMVWKQ